MTLDLATVLEAVKAWPEADRRELVDRVIEGLPDEEFDESEPLSDELKAELDRRLELYKDNPLAGEPWEVVYARLRGKS